MEKILSGTIVGKLDGYPCPTRINVSYSQFPVRNNELFRARIVTYWNSTRLKTVLTVSVHDPFKNLCIVNRVNIAVPNLI